MPKKPFLFLPRPFSFFHSDRADFLTLHFFLVDNGAAAANTAAPSFEPRGRTMQPANTEERKAAGDRESSDEREVDLNQL